MFHDWAKISRGTVVMATVTALTGCGGLVRKGQTGKGGGNEVTTAPPRAYYDQLFATKLALLDDSATAASAPGTTSMPATDVAATTVPDSAAPDATQPSSAATTPTTSSAPSLAKAEVMWLNFGGATVERGYLKGQSFLVCSEKATIAPSAALATASQDEIVKSVQGFYTAAGANLTVTDTKPVSGDYTTVVVGGSLTDLGCKDSGEFGASPLDIGNANHNDIAFVFAASGISDKQLAVNIAHVSAHTYGLANVSDATDIMAESPLDTAVGFAVGKLIGTGAEQNSPALLAEATGVAVSSRDGSGTADATSAGSSDAAAPATDATSTAPVTPAPVVPLKRGELLVEELIAFLPRNPTASSQIIPLLKSLLPVAAKLDPAAVGELVKASGLGGGAGSTTTSTTTTRSDGTTVTSTTTINVNVNINISNVWNGGSGKWSQEGSDGKKDEPKICLTGDRCADAVGKPVSPVATLPADKTVASAPETSASEPPANPAEAAKVINSVQPIVNIININFNHYEGAKLRPMMKMGCLQKYLAARGK